MAKSKGTGVAVKGDIEKALKAFNKKVARSGTLSAVKGKQYYEKPGVRNRKKKEEGMKNTRKREKYNR